MKKINIVFVTLVFSLIATCAKSQRGILPCGNGRINQEANSAEKIFRLKNLNNRDYSKVVRVYFTVFAYDNGLGQAATPQQIESEFTSLKASFEPGNICFLNMGVRYINNSNLDTNFNADDDPNGVALANYLVPNCMNIFYMQQIKGNNPACSPPCGIGGIALGGIPGTFFLVSSGNIGASNTIGHEMGHSLGLLHTFEPAYGLEKIDGSNSETTADQITDTNADPYVYNANTCFSITNNLYTGTCSDPNGATNFSPPYSNLMGYWPYSNPVATTNQFFRATNFLSFYNPLLATLSAVSFTENPITVNAAGFFIRSVSQTYTTNGAVTIMGLPQAIISGGNVQLMPGFTAQPGGGYTYIISGSCY